jgi:pimeloyl-ACP methyl ester carboxylesterase
MTRHPRNRLQDLRGVGRLAVDATVGVTELVEALHRRIAATPTRWGGPAGRAVEGIAGHVYRTVRGVATTVGGGLDAALGRLAPLVGDVPDTSTRVALIAALNGVLGDHLEQTANPLAIDMRLRQDGVALDLAPDALAARIGRASSTAIVAVHGLCMSDLAWSRAGHDHAASLARDLRGTAVYLHYNTGLHVSVNGRRFADVLEALAEAWPVPLARLVVVGHSMGGLVARSAAHYGALAGHRWRRVLASMVCLATPHLGSSLERRGHDVDVVLDKLPFAAPFARLGRVRSAGITDLRHGSVLDDDWQGHDPFDSRAAVHHPVPLPPDVACYAVAASRSRSVMGKGRAMRGDGLVSVASALGLHRDPRRALAFPDANRWIATSTGHLELLSSTRAYEKLREWLAGG